MANQQWTDFLSLVELDAQRTDWLGQHARALQEAIKKYMEVRFSTDQTGALVDIINDPAVISAVVTSLTNATNDAAAIKGAVAAVVAG
jgi:hypothetical protein